MRAALLMITFILAFVFTHAPQPIVAADKPAREEAVELTEPGEEIIHRVIKIEGSLEKPRTIFIVPKANLAESYHMRKGFDEQLLEPLPPDTFEEIIVK